MWYDATTEQRSQSMLYGVWWCMRDCNGGWRWSAQWHVFCTPRWPRVYKKQGYPCISIPPPELPRRPATLAQLPHGGKKGMPYSFPHARIGESVPRSVVYVRQQKLLLIPNGDLARNRLNSNYNNRINVATC